MLISRTRHADEQTYLDVLDILEMTIGAYQRTNDESLIPEIRRLHYWKDELKEKLESKDYTKDDERERRVDELLRHANK